MVSGDNFSDGIVKIRPALTDVTNRPEKRPFSLISGDSFPESGDGFRKMDANSGDLPFAKLARFQGRLSAGVSQGRPLIEGLTDHASENDDIDQGLHKWASSKCGAPLEWSTISGSQDSKFPGLERCVRLKGDGGENSTGEGDLLKGCSCSFCSTGSFNFLVWFVIF